MVLLVTNHLVPTANRQPPTANPSLKARHESGLDQDPGGRSRGTLCLA